MAAVSPDLIKELEELVNCPICLETFSDPRILRCHHSFCMECLEAVLGQGVMLCCPCCKRNTKVAKGVRNLPKDFRANSWLDKLNEHHRRSNTKTTTKTIEKPEKKHVQAEHRDPHLARNCQVCDQVLGISDTKTFLCGHKICRSCADFLTPAGGSIPHCPTCASATLPIHPATTDSCACTWEIPFLLVPPAPPIACQEESTARLRPSPNSDTSPHRSTNSDICPQSSNHPDTSPREVILSLQPAANIAASSREDVVCPQLSAPSRVSSAEAIRTPQALGNGGSCMGAGRTVSEAAVTPGTSLQLDKSSGDLCEGGSGLMFHPVCGRNIIVGARRNTALKRPKDVLVDAVVFTSRHLAPNEVFEVRLDKPGLKPGWSMEIGVTTHCPTEADFPERLYDLPLGTWSMLRSKVWHGKTIIKQYKKDLTNLKVGDHVGVERRENGDLHFYINGVSMGVAASNIPPLVHGVIDLRWGFDKVTIIKTSAHSMPTRTKAPTSACEQTALPAAERSSCCILI